MLEKRNHQRISCTEKCLIYYENDRYFGSVTNISLSGVLVKLHGCSPGTIIPGKSCSLILSSDPADSIFRYKARITRVQQKEVGLKILEHEL